MGSKAGRITRSIRSATDRCGSRTLIDNRNNAGAILNLPFSLQAAAKGMHSLGRTTDHARARIRPAASSCAAPGDAITPDAGQYLAAYVEALRWSLDARKSRSRRRNPRDKLKIRPTSRIRASTLMAEPGFGFAPDAKFDMAKDLQERAGAARRDRRRQASRPATLYRFALLHAGADAGEGIIVLRPRRVVAGLVPLPADASARVILGFGRGRRRCRFEAAADRNFSLALKIAPPSRP